MSVGDVVTVVKEQVDPRSSPEEMFEHYSIPSFDDGKNPKIELGKGILSQKLRVPPRAVLFSKLNPRIKRVWEVEPSGPNTPICSTEFVPMVVDSERLLEGYLAYFMRSGPFASQLQRGDGSTRSRERVDVGEILDVRIPLPTLADQRRIVARLEAQLGAAEAVRSQTKLQAEGLVALFDARLVQTFEALSQSARAVRIGTVAKTGSGTTPASGDPRYHLNGTIPWVKTADLRDGEVSGTEQYVTEAAVRETSLRLLPAGTLLVAMYGQGQTRGRTGVLVVPATVNQACFAVLPNETFETRYLQWWFRASYRRIRAESEGRGGNQPNLNGEILKSEAVPAPSRDEQAAVVAWLDDLERNRDACFTLCDRQKADLDSLQSRLLAEAFA